MNSQTAGMPGLDIAESVGAKTKAYRREWHERYAGLLTGRRHWKMATAASLLINAGMAFGYWDMARNSHDKLYVVERAGKDVSYVGAVQPVDMDTATWNAVRLEALKKFITAWRTVTNDSSAQKNDWDRAFAFLGDGSQARSTVSKWYEDNDPIKRAEKGELVTVEYRTSDVEGNNTFGVWWTETTTNQGGQISQTKQYRARIVYAQKLPSNQAVRRENPLGILATELSVEVVQ